MKINLILSLALTVIIGISLIPLIGSLSNDALSGQTEIINVESTLDGSELPTQISAGDTLVLTMFEFGNNVVYTETYRNVHTDTAVWGFSSTGESHKVHYNGTSYELIGGTWDAPVFGADYSDAWITWEVDGDTGTLTFLQDFPVELVAIYSSTAPTTPKYVWTNTTAIDSFSVYNTTEEVPVYTTTDRLVNLIPFFAVLILIGAVIVYIKFKKE